MNLATDPHLKICSAIFCISHLYLNSTKQHKKTVDTYGDILSIYLLVVFPLSKQEEASVGERQKIAQWVAHWSHYPDGVGSNLPQVFALKLSLTSRRTKTPRKQCEVTSTNGIVV